MSAAQTCKFYMVPKRKHDQKEVMNVEYVHIRQLGTPLSEYKGPAKQHHRSAFAKEYGEFLSGKKNLSVGEPITSLPNVEKRLHETLLQNGITTIEQLVEADDRALSSIPDSKMLKTKAKAYMAAMLADEEKEDVKPVAKRGRKPKQEDSVSGSEADDSIEGSAAA